MTGHVHLAHGFHGRFANSGPIKPRRLIASLALGAFTGACAHYSPAPLRDPGVVLTSPDLKILSADAQSIERPYLTPQAIDLSQPLTPDALAVLAVLENPDLRALRTKNGVADAQAFAARLLPDPSFDTTIDKVVAGPDTFLGFGSTLGFDLSLLRTRRARRDSGDAASRQVRLDLAWAEWQTAGQARLLGVRVLALTRQLALAQQNAAAAQRLFEASGRAAGRGDIPAGDLDSRRQAALDSADRERTTERDLVAARNDLNKQLGLAPDTLIRLAPDPAPIVPPSADLLTAQAFTRRLDLAALRAGYEAGEAQLHIAVLEQFPNLSLTLGGTRDTSDNRIVTPGVGFTLPLWNRNRGNIAIATATREQLKAEYEARLFQTRAEIAAAVAGIAAARRQRAELLSQLPAVREYAAATQRAARRGDLAPATADTAAQAARDRELTLAQLDQQISEQTIALELLTGGLSQGWTR